MATLGNTFPDLIDLYKSTSAPGEYNVGQVIEVLHKQNPILKDAVTVEANLGTIHRHKIRTGLPEPSWGRLYKGIKQGKSTYQQVDDTTGFLEARSTLDKRIIDLAPDKAPALRFNEAIGHLEGMSQKEASSIFYDDTSTNPDGIRGLSARYNVIGGPGAGAQVIDAGGRGSSNTSIWFVGWSEQGTFLIHPKGTEAGVKREDKGEQRITDGSGDPYFAVEELFTRHLGVAVGDWQYNARVANIDIAALQAGTVRIYDFMRSAYYRLKSRERRAQMGNEGDGGMSKVRGAIYMNRDVIEVLDKLSTNGGSSDNFVRLVPKEIEGEEVLTYRGWPIRETDSLLNTESTVPAFS